MRSTLAGQINKSEIETFDLYFKFQTMNFEIMLEVQIRIKKFESATKNSRKV